MEYSPKYYYYTLLEASPNSLYHLYYRFGNDCYLKCTQKLINTTINSLSNKYIQLCYLCMNDIKEDYSYNVNADRWQKTPNRKYRNMKRILKEGDIIIDNNKRKWQYLGIYSSFESRRNKELKEFYLLYSLEKNNLHLTKNLLIDQIIENKPIEVDINKIKQETDKNSKTYDDLLENSMILNLQKGSLYSLHRRLK